MCVMTNGSKRDKEVEEKAMERPCIFSFNKFTESVVAGSGSETVCPVKRCSDSALCQSSIFSKALLQQPECINFSTSGGTDGREPTQLSPLLKASILLNGCTEAVAA